MKLKITDDPHYYKKTSCSECNEFGVELLKHQFTDVLVCIECINDQIRALEIDNEKPETDEDKYRERNR